MTRFKATGLQGVAALIMAMTCISPAHAGVIVVDFEDVQPQRLITRDGREPLTTNGVTLIKPIDPGRGRTSASIVDRGDLGIALSIGRRVEVFLPPDVVSGA